MQRCAALANAHICLIYAALVVSPRALPDGLILVFQYPVKEQKLFYHEGHEGHEGLRAKKINDNLVSSTCSVLNFAPHELHG